MVTFLLTMVTIIVLLLAFMFMVWLNKAPLSNPIWMCAFVLILCVTFTTLFCLWVGALNNPNWFNKVQTKQCSVVTSYESK